MKSVNLRAIQRLLIDEDGPTTVEYAVILMLIILACIGAIQAFGGVASGSWQDTQSQISGAID